MSASLVLMAFAAGVIIARSFPLSQTVISSAESVGFTALCYMVFVVGILIGQQRDAWKKALSNRWQLILLPTGTIFVSIVSSVLAGKLLGMPLVTSAAIGSACGWYSLSGVAIAKIWGAEAGLTAFAVNFLRELLAFAVVPMLVRKSRLAAIALCGATAADTTLPLIAKSTDAEGSITGFVSGALITALVPIVITLIAGLTGQG